MSAPLPPPPGHPKVVGECVNYTGYVNEKGYGRRMVNGKMEPVHRIAYREAHGPIPEGMSVDHLCFNPSCINPQHLRLLTWMENATYQRSAFKTHCAQGHQYTPENTYRRPDKPTQRACKRCRDERAAARRPCPECGAMVQSASRAAHLRRHAARKSAA